jgi:hypothetical protein
MDYPRVGFSHTVPLPLQTAPVPGTGIHRPVMTQCFYETRGVSNTRGYLALSYTKGILRSK